MENSMEMSFFVVCPLRNCECKAPKIGMNCNQSLTILFAFDSSRFSGHISRIYKACPGATLRLTFLVLNEYGIFSVTLSPCKPGLGQGHTKKRHPHAQQNVSFTYNPEAERRGHLLIEDYQYLTTNGFYIKGMYIDLLFLIFIEFTVVQNK